MAMRARVRIVGAAREASLERPCASLAGAATRRKQNDSGPHGSGRTAEKPSPVSAAELNDVLAAAHARVDKLEPRLAAVIEPILKKYGDTAARKFSEHATQHLVAAGPDWTAPFPDQLIDVDALVAEILAKTQPVRDALIEQTMSPALAAAGIRFDVANPLIAGQIANTGAQVTNIAETTRANIMRIIGQATQNGLTVPQTSSLIREGMASASKSRSVMIARTEMARAVNGGSLTATQMVASATGAAFSKTWATAPGAQWPRHENYDGLNGQTVALEATFDVGGEQLQYPGDPSGDPGETINCFPGSTRVFASEASVGFRRWYVGSLVRVETERGDTLAGTPNHPILTSAGWKPLNLLREGDDLVCGRLREVAAVADPDVDHAPATIQQIVAALTRVGVPHRVRGRAVQFHGDPSPDGEVEVVTTDGELRSRYSAALANPAAQGRLVRTGEVGGPLATSRPTREVVLAASHTSDSVMGGAGEPGALLWGRPPHPLSHGGGTAPWLNAEFKQVTPDDGSTYAVALGQRLLGDAFEVSLAKVVVVNVDAFHGEVFNIQTRSGAYLAEGIIAHNCRCAISYLTPSGEQEADAEDPPELGVNF